MAGLPNVDLRLWLPQESSLSTWAAALQRLLRPGRNMVCDVFKLLWMTFRRYWALTTCVKAVKQSTILCSICNPKSTKGGGGELVLLQTSFHCRLHLEFANLSVVRCSRVNVEVI